MYVFKFRHLADLKQQPLTLWFQTYNSAPQKHQCMISDICELDTVPQLQYSMLERNIKAGHVCSCFNVVPSLSSIPSPYTCHALYVTKGPSQLIITSINNMLLLATGSYLLALQRHNYRNDYNYNENLTVETPQFHHVMTILNTLQSVMSAKGEISLPLNCTVHC